MKIEVEIDEKDLRIAIGRAVQEAFDKLNYGYKADDYIKERIAVYWKTEADNLIREAVSRRDELREKIASELARKLKAQLTAALRSAGENER